MVICCTGPWQSLTCVSLPRLVLPTPRLSHGWLTVERPTALIMLLYRVLGAGPGECSLHNVAPRAARSGTDSCSVAVVDSAGDWEDHFLVALRATFVIRWAPRGTQWKAEGVDSAALKDPA